MSRRRMKITPEQLEQILELRISGVSVRETARRVGVNPRTVQERWNQYLEAEAEARGDRLRSVRAQYVLQLERIVERALTAPDVPGDEDDEEGAPDPRMLAEATKAIQAAAKLQGLEAATKLEHSGPDGGPVEVVSPVDRLAEFLERTAQASASADTG